MSSPPIGIFNQLMKWAFQSNKNEEKQNQAEKIIVEKTDSKELFAPIVILELAIRALYPKNANVQYFISNYRLCPQDLEEYTFYGFDSRKILRKYREPGDRDDLRLLENQIDEFIQWYLIDPNKSASMGREAKQLLGYAKTGLIEISKQPQYKNTNTASLVLKFAKKIENAIAGVYDQEPKEITEFGARARYLFNSDTLNKILEKFKVALCREEGEYDLDPDYLKSNRIILEKKISIIQSNYIQLIKEATSKTKTGNSPSRKNSLNEGSEGSDISVDSESRSASPANEGFKHIHQQNVQNEQQPSLTPVVEKPLEEAASHEKVESK